MLAQRALPVPGGLGEIVDKKELDELRNYVRRGRPALKWPVSRRQIYAPASTFGDGTDHFQVLHEYQLLMTKAQEFFIVVALLGEEFAPTLGGPEMDGYEQWLVENHHRSPLYPEATPPSSPS